MSYQYNNTTTPVVGFTKLLTNTGSSLAFTKTEVTDIMLSLRLIYLCICITSTSVFGGHGQVVH